MELDKVGIDLGKTVFHLVALNRAGETVVRKKFSRSQLLRFTVNLNVRVIGMEACGGAHYVGRVLRDQGHDVRLMPAQYVKPFVKTNKNDFIDAEAIAEAVDRPRMRYVPIKSEGQLPAVLEDAEIMMSETLRLMLAQLLSELRQLTNQIVEIDQTIQRGADEQEACQRLMAIPGIGPITATAIVAAIGNGAEFRKARSFSAWLGLVPGEYTTGGKQKLLGISKR